MFCESLFHASNYQRTLSWHFLKNHLPFFPLKFLDPFYTIIKIFYFIRCIYGHDTNASKSYTSSLNRFMVLCHLYTITMRCSNEIPIKRNLLSMRQALLWIATWCLYLIKRSACTDHCLCPCLSYNIICQHKSVKYVHSTFPIKLKSSMSVKELFCWHILHKLEMDASNYYKGKST